MNQDMIKEKLLELAETTIDFTVTLTGKASRKVNGLYKPDTKEILLHNKNFTSDDQLLYTAIHEYAHHLRCVSGENSARSHDIEFWALFNTLLDDAEKIGIYHRSRSADLQKKIDDAKEIQAEILALEKKLGLLLGEIHQQSNEEAVRFEDVIQHDLQLSMNTVKEMCSIGQIPSSKINTLSLDATKQLARARGNEMMIAAIESGKSIAQIKKAGRKEIDDKTERLKKEQLRIQKTILMLQSRLELVIKELGNSYEEDNTLLQKIG